MHNAGELVSDLGEEVRIHQQFTLIRGQFHPGLEFPQISQTSYITDEQRTAWREYPQGPINNTPQVVRTGKVLHN
ncbi:Uncharacterised protein [Mycobacteroides abscessus subsp. massiliense]|nr:Uncharacterised protein [Mycobacteroides abscessus subsp. massiliense]